MIEDFSQFVLERIATAGSIHAAIEAVYDAIEEIQPVLTEQIAVAFINSWLQAIESTFYQLPDWIQDDILQTPEQALTGTSLWGMAAGLGAAAIGAGAIIEAISSNRPTGSPFPDDDDPGQSPTNPSPIRSGTPPSDPPGTESLFGGFGDSDSIYFPKMERAAESLLNRNVVKRHQFDAMVEKARNNAFTISGDMTDRAIAQYRDALVNDIAEGTSFEGFKDRIGNTSLAPHHLENVYRTNAQAAFRDGREAILQNPIVDSMFPYQEYIAIHDGRTRRNHKQLETLGLDGTGVYRRDDPFWDRYTPPIDYNCRCSVNVLTIEAAARKGVREAQEWARTGVPPLRPNWRLSAIPFASRPGFGHRSSVGAF